MPNTRVDDLGSNSGEIRRIAISLTYLYCLTTSLPLLGRLLLLLLFHLFHPIHI